MNTMANDQFYRVVENAGSHAVKGQPREKAIRLYCDQSDVSWNLQVRGPHLLGHGYQEGKAFMVATATLSREDLVALRAAIDAMLGEE